MVDPEREAVDTADRHGLTAVHVEQVGAALRVRTVAVRAHLDAGAGDAGDRLAERAEELGNGGGWGVISQPARGMRPSAPPGPRRGP